jgi:hypothetical protein
MNPYHPTAHYYPVVEISLKYMLYKIMIVSINEWIFGIFHQVTGSTYGSGGGLVAWFTVRLTFWLEETDDPVEVLKAGCGKLEGAVKVTGDGVWLEGIAGDEADWDEGLKKECRLACWVFLLVPDIFNRDSEAQTRSLNT